MPRIRTFLVALLSFALIAVFPAPSSAAFTNDSLFSDGRGHGQFAEFVASTRLVGDTVLDNDAFTYMSTSSDGRTVVAAGQVLDPLVKGVYGWSNPDTDWESRDTFDFVLLGDANGTKAFYFTKISADGSTVVARSDDGIYIWEKPVGGWSGEILPTVVQGNQLSNPSYSIGFYRVGWAFEQNIEIAGDGSFLALGADFSWSQATPVIILNRPGNSWSSFDTATSGYVRIEAPVVEAANSWGAEMSVNPLANEIAIKYKRNQVFIYDNLGTLVEDDFIVDPDLLIANPTITFNNSFALVGDTLVVSPNIANSQVLKEIYIYKRTAGVWDIANPTTWNATGLFSSDQNNMNGDVFILPDEETIVVNGISTSGAYILVDGVSGWESLTGRVNQTYYAPTAVYYETDGDVVLGGISGGIPKLSHPSEKPPALIDLVLTSTSVEWNNTMVPAIQVDFSYDPAYEDAIWYDAFIRLDGLQNAISMAGPGGTFYNTNAGMLVAGQTYNVCVYPYATNAANGLMGDPVCQDLKPGAPSKATVGRLTPIDGGFEVQFFPAAAAPTAAPITGYEYSIDDGVTWLAVTYTNFRYSITGLTNGTEVDVIVRAKNSAGNGPASEPVTGTPSAPTAATNVVATAGNGSAQVSFTPGIGASYHKVVANPGGRSCDVYSPNTGCTVSALTNGTAYTFTVEAYDDYDNLLTTSSASNSVTPSSGGGSVPGAPTGVSASAGNAEATVSWTAVSGATGYTVTSNPGSLTCVTSSTSCTVSGLTNGTAYTFTVVASNSNGPGPASSASASVTPSASGSAPNAPSGVTASGGNGRATVSWPAVSGATEYAVTSNPGGFTCTTSSTSCVVTGLENGTSYTFTVVASNSYGSSAASGASSAVTPAASGGGGGNSSGGFANDPKLEFVPPASPVEPGTAFASSGGKKVKAEQKKFGSSNSVKVEIGGKNPSTAAVSAVVGGTSSPLPLRTINGRKSLTPEERSELKIKMGGYKKGSQVQVYVNNLENDEVTFLGFARVREDGTVVKKLRLPANLASGQYNIQINGYGAKTDKIRINKLSIGANLIEKALDRIYFEPDSSSLNAATTGGIDLVIEQLREAEFVYIYSFTTGNPAAAFKAANDKLANDRAGKVRRYLIANGVDADRIVVTIVGAVLPRDTSKPWQNRRVDLYVDRQIIG